MFKRILPILGMFAILLVIPARAEERIAPGDMPVQGPYSTERSWEALSINGQTVGVVRVDYLYGAGPDDLRMHWVWHELNASGGIVEVLDNILIGGFENGVLYQRRNDEQRWKAGRMGGEGIPPILDEEVFWSKLPPADWPGDFTYVYIGDTDVNGNRSRQFQGHLNPEKMIPGVTLTKQDVFFTNQPVNGVENYLTKNHISLGLQNAAGGTDLLEYVIVAYDPNAPLVIGAPPDELVDFVGAQALTGLSSEALQLRSRIRGLALR